tara:strand:+ start:21060 stop:21491 length:432 start_codon:yes stop_codon:yes gene_type:complete
MKTVFVIEDEDVLRNLFYEYFEMTLPDMEIVGSSGNGQQAINECIEKAPDLAIVDIRLPEVNGLEILQVLKMRLPNTKVLIFSGSVNAKFIKIAVSGGVDGFVEKSEGMKHIKQAIDTLKEGSKYFSPSIASEINMLKASGTL